ncbi:EamA family transporter [Hymenobacter taeanensis]|uniref:EamA family transporter n=1 Tax=Hymenobacter taeanensis TaxID=2735321 RepID=A0A6M6BKN0_9BACT|nr:MULTISPECIES: EamA family transporter [Hymenobacter]QJX47983.1 EamA family transporter [Hymenobacter taeanensis]UOQ82569.1 EamA family transporter [Hymenobacter sp. 5414T-23]
MWVLFSLLAALSAAAVVTLSKVGVKNIESSLAFAIQSVLIITVAWSVVAYQGHLSQIAQIDRRTWLFLIAAGIVTCLSSLFSFQALKLGQASRTSSFDKISLVFSIILASVFLKEKLTWQVILGATLMAGGAILIAFSKPSEG